MVENDDRSMEIHDFKYFCRPENMAIIIGNRKMIFGTWGLIGYIGQFILIVAVVNVYSDADRLLPCNIVGVDTTDGSGQSAVYDTALQLMASYHIIEWVRFTIFLVTLLLGQNFMHLWYILSLNTLYGIAAYIYVHVARYSGNGLACQPFQIFRASMLTAEVIVFWTTFFIMSVPQIFYLFMKTEDLEEAMKEQDEDDEGGEENEEK